MAPVDWRLIFRVEPYQGFPVDRFKLDLQGWVVDPAVFDRLIAEVRPQLVIEVGTWKGASAVRMADALKRERIDGRIICVDTWLGALEFWTNQYPDMDRFAALGLQFGYPQVYQQFLANVILSGHQDAIIPFPNTSQTVARFLKYRGVRADLIYIDGSHEEADVYADMTAYWDLLNPNGGVLFGDDYANTAFLGLRAAVDRFARDRGLKLTILGGWYWVLGGKYAGTQA